MHTNIRVALNPNFMSSLLSSLYTMIKLSKTSTPQKLFDYDCVTLYNTLCDRGLVIIRTEQK